MKRAIVTSVFSVVLILAGFPAHAQLAPAPAATTTTTIAPPIATGSATIKITKTAGGTIGQSVGPAPPSTICTATATSCQATASSLLAVRFTPTPSSGMFFSGWSDGTGPASSCNGKKDPCGFIAAAGSTVTLRANFAQIPLRELRVEKVGQGKEKGVVTSDPPGIKCGSDCFAKFPEGTTIILRQSESIDAVPEGFETFTGSANKSGCAGIPPCKIVIMLNTSLQARFSQPGRILTLALFRSGTGQGTVEFKSGMASVPPAPHQCNGTTCSYRIGAEARTAFCTSVNEAINSTIGCAAFALIPTAAAGSVFAGWTNGTGPLRKCDGKISACDGEILGNESVTAVFVIKP